MEAPRNDGLELVPIPNPDRCYSGYWRGVLQKAVDNPGFAVRAKATEKRNLTSHFTYCRRKVLKPGQVIRAKWFADHTLIWVEEQKPPAKQL